MKVYKLRHKPTGLYFTPSRGSGNLSTTGKVYSKPPSVEWTSSIRIVMYNNSSKKKDEAIRSFFHIPDFDWCHDGDYSTRPEEWEIVEL